MVPFFSIIIPTSNSGESILTALESVIGQTFTEFEVLIIDNVSTDNTLQSLQVLRDERIKCFSEKDNGIYDAMNKGIKLAKGEILYFLGSDDKLFDNKVFEQIYLCSKTHTYDIIYGNVRMVGTVPWAPDGHIYDGEFSIKKLIQQNISHQAIFYRTEFVRKNVGNYNIEYKICADWDFNIRCMAKGKSVYIEKVIADFSAGGTSTNTFYDAVLAKDYISNLQKYLNISLFDPLINYKSFIYYKDLEQKQKNENYLRYLLNRIFKRRSFHSIKYKLRHYFFKIFVISNLL